MKQQTLSQNIHMQGIGLHSGVQINLNIKPAPADHGIVFQRVDVDGKPLIPARWDRVVNTQLCTMIGDKATGATVGTIEHLMSALRGCGVDNALIEIDGEEVPAMDGSALPFVEAIETAGLKAQNKARRVVRVLKEVRVEKDGKAVALKPSSASIFAGVISFDNNVIGEQKFEVTLENGNYLHDIAEARTFCFLKEVEYMKAHGRALGGSLENAVVLDENGVMNEGGLRFANEFIRHKLLDAIGDLYCAGYQIQGRYEGAKIGHEMNNLILHALFADEDNYELVTQEPAKICEPA